MTRLPDPDDPVVERAVESLRRLPPFDPDAVRSVVRAAAAARVAPADEPAAARAAAARSIRLWSAAGMTAAAAIVGFMARGWWSTSPASAPPAPSTVAAATAPLRAPAPASSDRADSTARLVSSGSAEILPVPQQFVFANARAHRVSVVGDFNQWNPASAPMTRSANGTFWSVVIPVLPGRHMYGFMIDDSIFTLDPRARTVRDPDLGTQESVLMVARP